MTDPYALSLGATLIRHFEDMCLTPKPDTAPHWQEGYGMNYLPDGSPVTAATPPITQDTAEAWLMQALAVRAAQVDAMIPATANRYQRAALYSFQWNEGEAQLAHSTLLKLFVAGNPVLAARQFAGWVYAGGVKLNGLVVRREIERNVFLGVVPDWAKPTGSDTGTPVTEQSRQVDKPVENSGLVAKVPPQPNPEIEPVCQPPDPPAGN